MTLEPSHTRPVVVAAVRRLIDAAQRERAALHLDHPDREFYLGVEAAAQEVLHPQLAMTRDQAWLDRQTRLFREGYLTEKAALAAVQTLADPPHELALPAPPATADA